MKFKHGFALTPIEEAFAAAARAREGAASFQPYLEAEVEFTFRGIIPPRELPKPQERNRVPSAPAEDRAAKYLRIIQRLSR